MTTATGNGQKIHSPLQTPPVVSRQEWEAAHQAMLVKEKAHIVRMMRSPPRGGACRGWRWRRRTLSMAPRAKNEPARFVRGAPSADRLPRFLRARRARLAGAYLHGCSLGADQVSNLAHLHARGRTLVYASRAPQPDIQRLKARMPGTDALGSPSPTASMRTLASINGTATTRSSATAIASSAPTSSTTAATVPWAPCGATSISPRLDGKRSGKIHRSAVPAGAAVQVGELE